ncbi:MAG: ABC transporter permease subunit, partial [Gaiellaceae bacterium]
GPWQRLRFIILPMLSPVILFNVILQLVACFSYFTQVQVIEAGSIGGPGTSTWMYVQYLYQQAFEYLKLGYSSAMAFFLFVISAIVMVLLFRSSSRWVYYASEG